MALRRFSAMSAILLLAPAVLVLGGQRIHGAEPVVVSVTKTGSFADARIDLEQAIVDAGLKIDFNGHVGKMLERTGADVGSTRPIYTGAEYFTFCSAQLSRKAMEADPANMHVCPYVVFVYERADQKGKVHIGYRRQAQTGSPASRAALAEIDKLLDRIVRAAAR